MTVNEAFQRIVRAHLAVILTSVVLCMLVTGIMAFLRGPTYEAVGRLELGGGLASSNVAADAASQRLQGIVTSPSMVRTAMADAQIEGDPVAFAKDNVVVRRVGVSPVVEVAVQNSDRERAHAAAVSLIQQALNFTNGTKSTQDEKRLEDLNKSIGVLTANRTRLINQLPGAAQGRVLMLQAQIAGLEPTLADTLRQRSDLILTMSSRSSAVLLDPVFTPNAPVSRWFPQQTLAGLLGLVLGLGIAAALEAGRPRLRGARSVASSVGAPLLGHLPRNEPGSKQESLALDEITAKTRLMTDRYGNRDLVLVPVGLNPRGCDDLAAGVAARTGRHVGVYAPSGGPTDPLPPDPLAVVVSAPVVDERDVIDQRDLLESLGWPLVGVVTVGAAYDDSGPRNGSRHGPGTHNGGGAHKADGEGRGGAEGTK